MQEIIPGLFHWTARHPKIHILVHSHYVAGSRVLIDPLLPGEGIEWFRKQGPPEHVLLTNRHHYRHSGKFVEAFGATVHCHRAGLHEFTHGEKVEPFEFGEELAGGILALEVGALCPEETAFRIPRGDGTGQDAGDALALGDAVIQNDDGTLGFVPDEYMGDDPKGVKRGLMASLRRLLDEPFKHLLMAHGEPIVGVGKSTLMKLPG